MRNNNPPWLVAFIASSYSFFSVIFSILFSDLIQKLIDVNKHFLFILDVGIINFIYTGVECFIEGYSFSSFCITIGLLSCLFLWEVGFVQFAINKFVKVDINHNIHKLFNPLNEFPHHRINLVIFFKTIKRCNYTNLMIITFSFIFSDTPSFLISALGIIGLFFLGVIYQIRFRKWENTCFRL